MDGNRARNEEEEVEETVLKDQRGDSAFEEGGDELDTSDEGIDTSKEHQLT